MEKTVSVGSVSMVVKEVESGKRAGSVRINGKKNGKFYLFGTAKDMESGIEKAREMCLRISQENSFLHKLTRPEIDLCRYVLENELTIEDLTPLVASRSRIDNTYLVDVLERWKSQKIRNNNYSAHYQIDIEYTSKRLIDHFGNPLFSVISTCDLEDFLDDLQVGLKRRKNIRALLGNLWKWAVSRKYASENEAVNIVNPKIRRRNGGHAVLTPDQFKTLLENVREPFLPWLVIGGFAGLRGSEIYGSPKFEDDRLRWEDFDWRAKRISVRPETSKTDLQRFVPICEALESWLEPYKGNKGFVHTAPRPHHAKNEKVISETKRLGELIGGWPSNCLRASRASYRVAQTDDIGMTAMEDGHTVEELKKSYLNPRYKEDAEKWFSLSRSFVLGD